jgi:hypothetical protein
MMHMSRWGIVVAVLRIEVETKMSPTRIAFSTAAVSESPLTPRMALAARGNFARNWVAMVSTAPLLGARTSARRGVNCRVVYGTALSTKLTRSMILSMTASLPRTSTSSRT